MRLNHELIRDILFSIEEHSTYKETWSIFRMKDRLEDEKETIQYHLRYLLMNGFVYVPEDYKKFSINDFHVDLTPIGHEYLSNIRSNTAWNKTKEIASKAGAESLKMICSISEKVISSYISGVISQGGL